MKTLQQTFTVSYSFPVIFTRGAFHPDNDALSGALAAAGRKTNRTLVVMDASIADADKNLLGKIERYGQRHRDILEFVDSPFFIRGGEVCKNEPAGVEKIHELTNRYHLCRHSFVLAIGGGAVLDIAGYAAATAHRGIRLIRMPTTTLSQNDAGVGVKTGINAFGRKNYLGTFTPPYAVINDFAFLDTLPERDKRAGIAEAVKVAIIKDRAFFDDLYRNRHKLAAFDADAMERMIIRCAELHMEHIGASGDPFECGSARPLDFGHWSAHKIEELTGGDVKHGEAVAMGIALDSLYSFQIGNISEIELRRIFVTLEDIGFDLYHWALGWLDIGRALREFQEHLGGDLTITLLDGIGSRVEVHEIDTALLRKCIDRLSTRKQDRRSKNDHAPEPEIRTGDSGHLLHREPRPSP
ncbi:MAG: 3-dehydroquinate synthase [Deltaproteobacteria bacterium]|nr:3-dehydroquinate synthase [Deltaproteobacteria bacterium]